MPKAIYGIEEFPNDDSLWRVVWFGGVSRNPRVPTEPLIETLLAALPDRECDPLSPRSRQSTVTHSVKIGVGQLPYVSIGSVWHKQRPVQDFRLARREVELTLDTSVIRFESLDKLAREDRVIPMKHYTFAGNYPYAKGSQLATIECFGDPWAVMIPVIELIRFYYAQSTRLAQALFWGQYTASINPEKCGRIGDDLYRVHLRRWIYDTDAWTLARFHASEFMQQQVRKLYHGIQKHHTDSLSMIPGPFRAYQCGFPFAGKTKLRAVSLKLPGQNQEMSRYLVLKLLRCSAPFPFHDLVCDRDNRNMQGANAGDENLPAAWIMGMDKEDDEEDQGNGGANSQNRFHSDSEPLKSVKPMVVEILENRFTYLDGRKLIKEPTEVQKYRSAPIVGGTTQPLDGFGTGDGIWGKSNLKPANLNTTRTEDSAKPPVQTLPADLDTFFGAIGEVAKDPIFAVQYVAGIDDDLWLSDTSACVDFPTYDPAHNRDIGWSKERRGRNEWRPRRVAIAQIETRHGLCYVIEAERLRADETMSTLIFARMDLQAVSAKDLWTILLGSACKGRWMSKTEMADYRRGTTTHQRLVDVNVLARRISKTALALVGTEMTERDNNQSTGSPEQSVEIEPATAPSDVGFEMPLETD